MVWVKVIYSIYISVAHISRKRQLKACRSEWIRFVLIVCNICTSSSRKIHACFVGVLAHAQSIFPPVTCSRLAKFANTCRVQWPCQCCHTALDYQEIMGKADRGNRRKKVPTSSSLNLGIVPHFDEVIEVSCYTERDFTFTM